MFKLKFSQIKTLFEEKRILLGKINYPGVDVNTLLNTKGQLSDLYIKHGRIKDEDFCIFPDAFSIEPYSCFFTGTTFCSMGGGSYCNASVNTFMNIGRYCSIGRAFIVMGGNHPMDFVTTSSCIYDFGLPNSVACLSDFPASPNKYPYFKRYNRDGSINIGNDVWIGEEVKIKRGVNISTGTVVAANSIVTKDVAPYTVVGGIPARPIKQRFSDEVISDLLDSKWWEYDYSQICTLSLDSPKIFLEELKYRVISGLKPNRNINPLTQDDLKKITSQK